MSQFKFARRNESGVTRTEDLAALLGAEALKDETWLCVSPHDDDIVMGAGLWQMAAIEAGADVHLLVVTDGRMGYCSPRQRDAIVDIRKQEVYDSSRCLGLAESNVHFMGMPDCQLAQHQGRRRATHNEDNIAGYTGLCNTFVHHLRKLRPDRVLVPAATDLHPDHQVTHNELMISLFHASGEIWPELGKPTPVPAVYELAVYCDFAQPPNLQVKSDDAAFQKKLDAVAAYQSQLQIEQLVAKLRDAGPTEYLHEVAFNFYSPTTYHKLFE